MSTRFYILVHGIGEEMTEFETDYLPLEPHNIGDKAPRCPTCGGAIGRLPWLPPHRIKLETWGKNWGDIIKSGNLLISERFANLWKREGLVGLSGFDPVEVVKVVRHKRFRGDPPNYFRVDVVCSQAAVDLTASGAIMDDDTPVCPDCRLASGIKSIKRLALESNPSPIEDIFVARGLPGTYVTSERFKKFCDTHEIKNAILKPADEYSFSYP